MDDEDRERARQFERAASDARTRGEYEKHNEYITKIIEIFTSAGKGYDLFADDYRTRFIDVAAERAKTVVAPDVLPWDQVFGLDEIKRVLIAGLHMPLKLKLPVLVRGVLLYGPPGTGKTQIVSSFAAHAKLAFVCVHTGEVMKKFLGDSEKFITGEFARATAAAPAIIFFDEVDALISARTQDEHGAERRVKNTFLDLFTSLPENVFLFAATNRAFDLDDAFKRRFSHAFPVGLPDASARRQMFQSRLPQEHRLSTTDMEELVTYSNGLTGSAIVNALRTAPQKSYNEICEAEYFKKIDGAWHIMSEYDAPADPNIVKISWEKLDKVFLRPLKKSDVVLPKPILTEEKIKMYLSI